MDGISFEVPRGRFFGFLGPNGAGKSTTIKMLTGLLRPTAGEVTIEGLSLERDLLAVKRVIGVLPEELPLYERLTGEEYLHFAGRMYGLGRDETRRRTEELLEFLSLEDERGKLIVDYSQGMRKKVALAAALIHNPRVLFLDEPLNGIDPVSGRVVTDLLRRLAGKGVTLFFTTHVLDVVERLCDEVAIIDRGRLIAQGTLDEIRAQREVAQDATLEDVFLKLVSADVRAGGPVVDRLIALVLLRWRLELRGLAAHAGAAGRAGAARPDAAPVRGLRHRRRLRGRAHPGRARSRPAAAGRVADRHRASASSGCSRRC